MSGKNVEIVRRTFDIFNAFARDELSSEAVAELLGPQIEWHWHDRRTYPDTPQHLRGAEFIRFMEQLREAWDDLVTEPLEFIEAPDGRVVTRVRQSGHGRESGVPIEIHFCFVWTVRNGAVRVIETFRHHTDALEAVGLSE